MKTETTQTIPAREAVESTAQLSPYFDGRQSFYGKALVFLKQNGFKADTKKQIMEDYGQ